MGNSYFSPYNLHMKRNIIRVYTVHVHGPDYCRLFVLRKSSTTFCSWSHLATRQANILFIHSVRAVALGITEQQLLKLFGLMSKKCEISPVRWSCDSARTLCRNRSDDMGGSSTSSFRLEHLQQSLLINLFWTLSIWLLYFSICGSQTGE